ncbi:MAG TPA: MFS transporter [Pseudomonadota bacterium]|nr:MFS transporter [Pseudomonadota bacterium]HNO67136.1 MFS transporter [Pseudomonadota bacterium]
MQRAFLVVVVAALGYFVDILDLFLFNVVRQPSLRDLGVSPADSLFWGMRLLNAQMVGVLVGAFVFGTLGDRLGRLRALYGSILIYSVGTLLNGLVDSVETYAFCRLLAGFGLAGELGAAVTLVSETLPQSRRGLGTTLVAGFGLCGGVAAALLAEWLSWRTCYFVGGSAGLLLLFLRLSVAEPQMFVDVKQQSVRRGSLALLLATATRRRRFLQLLLIGLPVWFVAGIVIAFSPELSTALGTQGVTAARAVLISYIGVALGDLLCGVLSQVLKSRRRAMLWSLSLLLVLLLLLLRLHGLGLHGFYALCFGLGLSTGYWAVLVTTAAEQFGTNLRATVTTTVPNLVRASVIPLGLLYQQLVPTLGTVGSVRWLGGLCVAVAVVSLWLLPETYHRELAFLEHESRS